MLMVQPIVTEHCVELVAAVLWWIKHCVCATIGSATTRVGFVCCRWWQVPYFWVGIKAYDIVAGRQTLKTSYFLSKSKALEQFPMLKKDRLCGALVYYDGRTPVALLFIEFYWIFISFLMLATTLLLWVATEYSRFHEPWHSHVN